MKYKNIREEELKNKVGADWFKGFDTTEIIGNIDFTVFPKQKSMFGRAPLLWAEAKTGNYDLTTMFVQLILTIGKARTFDKTLPPAFWGAFDFKKIAFVPYSSVQDIFYLNDFNWNVTPSNHETKEFKLIAERIEKTLKQKTYVYDYLQDEKELKFYISNNVAKATDVSKIKIDKNNFIPIYQRWLDIVKPIIDVNWDELKKANILDSDFYLADLFVDDRDTQPIADDITIRENLFVIFQNQGYKIARENIKQMFDAVININSKETYQQFWKRYKRPPTKEFQEYIIEHRDLLVPQDIRERKGAFFTPQYAVELSQKYLTDYLGEDWQDEYYIWDCAAGTGNLLAGLTNKYNIWASTIDQADVNVMHERIDHGANLLKNHVFQFDFLNDDFSKCPPELQKILNDEKKRKKLVIYINPPYAEAATATTVTGTGENKSGVAIGNKTNKKYKPVISKAANQLFALFFIRIYKEIPSCILAEFSTLKILQSTNFTEFRKAFRAKLNRLILIPADSFDNVKGHFPIGFFVWDTNKQADFAGITADVYDNTGKYLQKKNIYFSNKDKYINYWLTMFRDKEGMPIGMMNSRGNNFQHQNLIYIQHIISDKAHALTLTHTRANLMPGTVYFSVRHCIRATWLNDCDQFLYPSDSWKSDKEFHSDCLAFALFHGQNRISSRQGVNHWIPFREGEVDAKEKFESNFMSDYIAGKISPTTATPGDMDLFSSGLEARAHAPLSGVPSASLPEEQITFSAEASAVFDAGRELWRYYHSQPGINVNASLYDIREHFQGRTGGRMNNKSDDEHYTALLAELRNRLGVLAKKLEPKVYEHGFLK